MSRGPLSHGGRGSWRALTGGILVAWVLLAAAACRDAGVRRSGEPPRHALLITVGHLRADRLTSLHYPRPTTYTAVDAGARAAGRDFSLDGLVGRGVAFASAFTPTTRAPGALATLLTGLHPVDTCRFKAEDMAALEPGRSLAEAFSRAGFRSAAFTAGFSLKAGVGLGLGFATVGDDDAESTDENVLREAAGWIDAQGATERSFLWVHLRGLSASQRADGSFESASYDEALTATNARLAGFLEHLADLGRLADTAIVLTSPGGGSFAPQNPGADRPELLDQSLHVPLVLSHPKSLTGRRVFGGVVGLEAVAPTLREWFELPAAGNTPSLLPWVDGKVPAPEPAALAAASPDVLSLRVANWRLVVEVDDETERLRLYDVARDPGQRRDVSSMLPERLRKLCNRMESILDASTGSCVAPRVRSALARP